MPSVSIIIPVRDEAGNLPAVFARTPHMGDETELVFVEGHSKDRSPDLIRDLIERHPELHASCHQQTGTGKGDAVRLGLSRAHGDILMIMDADLSVPPEKLPDFYTALISRSADLANGVRFVYPMEKGAMPAFNRLGNRLFASWMGWLIGQPIRDALCGTKAFWKKDYERMQACRAWSMSQDPYGDFDLLLCASELGLKIADIRVPYRSRIYGRSKIHRFRDGWALFKKLARASWRVKLRGLFLT
jgi:glycosyltransferase involved in cell wall biosynthesis